MPMAWRRARARVGCAAIAVSVVVAIGLYAPLVAHASATGTTGTTGTTGATGPTTTPEVISPLPGTPDAMPTTQISFLGAPGTDLQDIVVVGSVSGHHTGRLELYSTHTGGSFLPRTPFVPGEHVHVSAEVVANGTSERVTTYFAVASPYVLPASPPRKPLAITATDVQRFHSRHDLEPTAVTVTRPAADPTLGDIFISPDSGPGQAGPMIITPTGQLVWFDPLPGGQIAFDLNRQFYEGQPVLTWFQGRVVEAHGQGVDEIYSDNYTHLATVRAGNGLYADLHDFQITSQGTAFITAFEPEHWDLAPYGGPSSGLIDDGVMQEIDIKTGLVMFEWHALGHVSIKDTYLTVPHLPSTVFDFFHINSIDLLSDGDILISSRDTWATYLIDGTAGAVIWRLGGKASTFALGPGVRFAWQHDAELLPDGTITLFDNEASPDEGKESRALDIAINTQTDTATLVSQLTYPGKGVLSPSQGNVQQLPNGDQFVGWGQAGGVSEFSPTGQLTFDMHIATPGNSYRAFRYQWSGQPLTAPTLVAAAPAGATTQLYMSWNGATDVASWQVLAGSSPTALTAVGTYPSTGFETGIAAPALGPYFEVQALDATGASLATSAIVKAGTKLKPGVSGG
jgi:hypothetical protein